MELTGVEQAQLASFIHTEGFQILCKIMKDEAFRFNSDLLLAKKPEDILQAHSLAAAATKFHDHIMHRIESEVQQYTQTPKVNDPPEDFTEGMLDTGGISG